MQSSAGLAALALGLAVSPRAATQEIQLNGPLTGVEATGVRGKEPGTKRTNKVVLPSGQIELGAELSLITCDDCVAGNEAKVSDVALARALARRGFGDRLELALGASLLAKQPQTWEEPGVQAAFAAVRVAFARHFAAANLLAVGPLFGETGHYWQFESALVAKAKINYLLRYELALGQAFTGLSYGEGAPAHAWLEELKGHFEAQLGPRDGAFWVGASYAVPLGHGAFAGERPRVEGRAPDPGPRLDLEIGGVMNVEDWDLYVVYALVDRGERAELRTQLPILDGGFDQRQIVSGLRYRFGSRDDGD